MEAIESTRTAVRGLPLRRFAAPAAAGWGLAFALVFYLALRGGGTDVAVRAEVGLLIWWGVLLVSIAGFMPRFPRLGWAAVALVSSLVAWTAVGLPGSESAERTVADLDRVATYLGVLLLGLGLAGRCPARSIVHGVAAGIGVIATLAVLSRMAPELFPANAQKEFLPSAARRLSYPLNYWNALAAFAAMGVPLLLAATTTARTLAAQAAAAAALPLCALCVFLSVSRGGLVALVVGLVAYLLLAPQRIPKLATVAVAAAGAAILVTGAAARDALQRADGGAVAQHQGIEMLWLAGVVCLGVALLQVAIGLGVRHGALGWWSSVPRRNAVIAGGLLVFSACTVALAFGLSGRTADAWSDFKLPPVAGEALSQDDLFARLQSTSGSGRYQLWEAAVDANGTAPLTGIGSGTYEYWWARHATIDGFVRDAHSLYLETFAELGFVGLAMVLSLVALIIGSGIVRALRAPPALRVMLAAATAAAAVFFVDAAAEWIWEIPVMPATLFLLAAVLLAGRELPDRGRRFEAPIGSRSLLAAGALAALALTVVALSSAGALRASQAQAAGGNAGAAIEQADLAIRLQPYAAAPRIQRALVLEGEGRYAPALADAVRATRNEPTNWRMWLVRSRLELRLDESRAALRSFRRARSLNPRSGVFRTE